MAKVLDEMPVDRRSRSARAGGRRAGISRGGEGEVEMAFPAGGRAEEEEFVPRVGVSARGSANPEAESGGGRRRRRGSTRQLVEGQLVRYNYGKIDHSSHR